MKFEYDWSLLPQRYGYPSRYDLASARLPQGFAGMAQGPCTISSRVSTWPQTFQAVKPCGLVGAVTASACSGHTTVLVQ